MEQNEQARLSALSNATMFSAIGVTLMYGLSILLALLAPQSPAVAVVSLVGLILWLIGMYNTSSALKGFNDKVAASIERIFKAQVVIAIAAVAYVVLIILIPEILGYSGNKASIVIIKLLTIALFVCTIRCMVQCNNESRALKLYGLKSMGAVSIAFTIQLVLLAVCALLSLIVLFRAGDAFSFLFRNGFGGVASMTILIGIAGIVAAVFMIIGWWSVRSELARLSADEEEL